MMRAMPTANMHCTASAASAEAQSPCAQTGAFYICLILDAIIVASIIISLISLIALGLAVLLGIRGLLLGVILLAVTALVANKIEFRRKQGRY